jgi:hypothetical protein
MCTTFEHTDCGSKQNWSLIWREITNAIIYVSWLWYKKIVKKLQVDFYSFPDSQKVGDSKYFWKSGEYRNIFLNFRYKTEKILKIIFKIKVQKVNENFEFIFIFRIKLDICHFLVCIFKFQLKWLYRKYFHFYSEINFGNNVSFSALYFQNTGLFWKYFIFYSEKYFENDIWNFFQKV